MPSPAWNHACVVLKLKPNGDPSGNCFRTNEASSQACAPGIRTVAYVPQGRCCYWGGWGGSVILADLDRRVTFAYMMNNMAPGIIGSDRSEAYVRATYACLD